MKFSKSKMMIEIEGLMQTLEEKHGFDFNNGYSQVLTLGEEVNREFGKYMALRDLYFTLENNMFNYANQ